MRPIQDPSFFFFSLLSPLVLLALSTTVLALDSSGWSVVPSNNSGDLSWIGKARFHLESAQLQLPPAVSVAPLTTSLVRLDQSELKNLDVAGNLVTVDSTNTVSLNSSDIAFISCDPSAYPGNLDASHTVANVITSSQRALAILLYSSEVHHCNYSAGEGANGYTNVFTLVNPNTGRNLRDLLNSSKGNRTTSIVPNMSFISGTPTSTTDSGGTTDSPNTAMIILYSITGIITALFLAIIITGAVRAHRHPERYGPRYAAGRPRQSRAKGMARAMLDTIPIVKFGDQQHDPKLDAVKGDIEMGAEDETGRQPDDRETTTISEAHPQVKPAPQTNNDESSPEQQSKPTTETPTDHPNFSCPICTDDFVKGQDLRVLPCNHQFHPECIDPWLVNVSGTCPLCRIDLNPNQTEGENTQEGEGQTETQQETPQEPTADEAHHRHRRLTSYLHGTLNARRMREATVEERLEALRTVREENRNSVSNEDAEERRLRSRLTTRLRDRFRIRTRRHGDDGEHRETNQSSTN